MAVANGGFLHEGLQAAPEPVALPSLPAEPLPLQGYPAPYPPQPISAPGWQPEPAPIASEAIVGIQKNILKEVQVSILSRTMSKLRTYLMK